LLGQLHTGCSGPECNLRGTQRRDAG
jgi:hypothetical protein